MSRPPLLAGQEGWPNYFLLHLWNPSGLVSEALQGAGGVEVSRMALLSEEGSTIETAVEIVRGVVP